MCERGRERGEGERVCVRDGEREGGGRERVCEREEARQREEKVRE